MSSSLFVRPAEGSVLINSYFTAEETDEEILWDYRTSQRQLRTHLLGPDLNLRVQHDSPRLSYPPWPALRRPPEGGGGRRIGGLRNALTYSWKFTSGTWKLQVWEAKLTSQLWVWLLTGSTDLAHGQRVSDFLSVSVSLCLFLSGICLLQQLTIHSGNIYSPLTLGNFLPLMPTWPHWSLTVNSERRNGSFGYIIVSSVLPGSLADLIGIIMGSKNLHYCTHAIRKALCKVLGVSRKWKYNKTFLKGVLI